MRLTTGKRAETLLELMYHIEYFALARAWEGLTDEEWPAGRSSGPMTTSSK
jgi:hypothetical protein